MLSTPIIELNNYRNDNIRLFIKREDLIPFSFGGNKYRIAEEFFEDMKKYGHNCMIGYGDPKSNLSRILANLCHSKGIECHIISSINEGVISTSSNSLIVKGTEATIHYCSKDNVSNTVKNVLEQCKKKGLLPYYIYGNNLGTGNLITPLRAYSKVYEEILLQSKKIGVGFDYIYVGTGTGMTQAGLIIGDYKNSGNKRITGISIARKRDHAIRVIRRHLDAYFETLSLSNSIDKITVVDDYLLGGYGEYNSEIVNTVKELFLKEGIPMDLTYVGKAFYGMLNDIKAKNLEGNVLFIHTGGTPLFFDSLTEIFK